MKFSRLFAWMFCGAFAVLPASLLAAEADQSETVDGPSFSAEHIDFFEKSVKPILAGKCFKCHGAERKLGGHLRLTNRAGALKGGETGPAVSIDDPDESVLLSAINYDEYEMPPKGKLPQAEIDILTKWVKLGAPWTPGDEGPMHEGDDPHAPPQVNEETRKFWSFQPITRPAVPKVKNANWVKNPIDAFISRGQEKEGFHPAPPADRLALIRRATYDLTGLPPKQFEVEHFLADKSPDAYEKLIDRLLASPQYGEKWGRHWLDLVHYAESNSYERDNPKPEVWRYRDYVIRSLNQDKPMDQFYREQLAGDELPNPTVDSITATGYYRLGIWDDESADPPLARYDELDDWVTITGQVMLGLTINCARCHDHKIDPIPQEDYYKFLAFFHGVKSFQNGPNGERKRFNNSNFTGKASDVLPPEAQKRITAEAATFGPKIDALKKRIEAFDKKLLTKLTGGQKDDYSYESNRVYIAQEVAGKLASQAEVVQYVKDVAERKELERQRSTIDANLLCAKGTPKPQATHIKIRGNAGVNGKKVQPGFPSVLGFEAPVFPELAPGAKSSGRRLVLAKWLTNEKHPLTSRVLANRLWQHHFGRGIVRSTNNFGFGGRPATHPELLDWLAAELMQRGWKLKTMHKLIMTSATYRMSSQANANALAKDPQNNAFWRFNMRRLTAEEIRDTVLATNGRLNLKMGGKSFYPLIPREVLASQSKPGAGWGKSSEEERARRSVYIHIKRSLVVPMLAQFDVADTDNTCPVRFESTVPTQALGMLNSEFMNSQAKVLAERLKKDMGDDVAAQVRRGLSLTLTRPISDEEVARGVKLINDLQQGKEQVSADEALRIFCLMVLNLNEYIYLD